MSKNIRLFFSTLALMSLFTACNDYETYAEQKDKERDAVNRYISKHNIKVISEAEFLANDTTTDVSKNEFVLFENTGVYMQIVSRGTGNMIKTGEKGVKVLARFSEYSIMGDSLYLTNNLPTYAFREDKLNVTKNSGTFQATFDSRSSLMYDKYGSTTVPGGWLVPMSYIRLGRMTDENSEKAHVRIIVPHGQGHSYASTNVLPFGYDIVYMRGQD